LATFKLLQYTGDVEGRGTSAADEWPSLVQKLVFDKDRAITFAEHGLAEVQLRIEAV
jgi:hypothetical protein